MPPTRQGLPNTLCQSIQRPRPVFHRPQLPPKTPCSPLHPSPDDSPCARVLYTRQTGWMAVPPGVDEKCQIRHFRLLTPKRVAHITRPSLKTAAPQDAKD